MDLFEVIQMTQYTNDFLIVAEYNAEKSVQPETRWATII